MKVIFLPNNTASLVSANIPALRRLGVEAVGYNFAPLNISDTRNVRIWPHNGSFLTWKRIKFLLNFVSDLLTADIIHWMYAGNSRGTKVALLFIRLLNKKKFVEFSGTDIRSLEKVCNDVDFYEICQFSDQAKVLLGTEKTSRETNRRFSQAGFYPIPSYPELIEYIDPLCFMNYSLISRSVDLERLKPVIATNSLPLIVHAPSNPEVKGTKYILDAAMKLETKGLAKFKLIQGMKHDEALSLLQNADIVVDQLIIGDFGVLAIEAMALQKPVVCFMRPKVLSYYEKNFEGFPVINANINDIYEVLENLVTDSKLRAEKGKLGRRYVEKYHDPDKNAELLVNVYSTEA